MAALLLTPDNLDALKSRLRAALLNLKSSHASEALAAALGYRTHAALLADLKSSPSGYPPIAHISGSRLAERLSGLAASDGAPDAIDLMQNGLPDPIWCVARKGDRVANSEWHHECRKRGLPLIFVYLRGQSAQLDWDYITIDSKREAHLHDEPGRILEDRMIARFQERAANDPGNPRFKGTVYVGRIERLTPATARKLADDFFEMLYTPVRAA